MVLISLAAPDLKHQLLDRAAEIFHLAAVQARIDQIRPIGVKIRLLGDHRLRRHLRREQLQAGIQSIFLEQPRFIGHPDRRKRAARLRVGHDDVGFFRFAARCPPQTEE